MRIPLQQSQRRRIDEINVTLHQLAEGCFGTIRSILGQERLRIRRHFSIIKPRRGAKPNNNFSLADRRKIGKPALPHPSGKSMYSDTLALKPKEFADSSMYTIYVRT